jgi:hypothetical protein
MVTTDSVSLAFAFDGFPCKLTGGKIGVVPRVSAIALFSALWFAPGPEAFAQVQRGRSAPLPDGSENDIHLSGTLKNVISRTYPVAPQQIIGPAWLGAITGGSLNIVQVPPGTTADQTPQILQTKREPGCFP